MSSPGGGVRPLDYAPPPRRGGWAIAALVAVVLVGSGILLAMLNRPVGGPGSSVPTIAESPEETAATAPPTPTTVPVVLDGLSSLVPGFEGEVRAMRRRADGSLSAWTWGGTATSPSEVELAGRGEARWDPFLERIAAVLDVSVAGPGLWFGPPADTREVFPGVTSFAWHPTDSGRLAFVRVPQADGRPHLWRSLPESKSLGVRTFTSTLVARLEFEGRLLAYGDWGYLFVDAVTEDRLPLLITLDHEGKTIAQAQYGFIDAAADGRLLVSLDTTMTELGVVGPELFPVEPVPFPADFGAVWSPDGRWIAAVAPSATNSTLTIGDATGSKLTIPLDVDAAFPVAWSSDGRWLLLTGLLLVDGDEASLSALIFVDLSLPEVYAVPVPTALSALAIKATGEPGSLLDGLAD